MRLAVALCLAAAFVASDGAAHDKPQAAAAAPAPSGLPLPFDLGGNFVLTDQHGRTRTEADPEGRLQLLFFGYANCESICSVALPQMVSITEGLAEKGIAIAPVMITVDPARDTPEAMAPILAELHTDFVGLTGPAPTLAEVYKLFAVENTVVFEDPDGGPVYAHGSLLYLLDGQGKFLTLLPPILTDERVMEIIAAYAPAG